VLSATAFETFSTIGDSAKIFYTVADCAYNFLPPSPTELKNCLCCGRQRLQKYFYKTEQKPLLNEKKIKINQHTLGLSKCRTNQKPLFST
jgi:hypothetical protein